MTRGQPFGRYELLSRISAGGMAEVFLALHVPSGTNVALKRILPEVAEDEEFVKMFEDEARIASQLEHPYIARCLDFGRVNDAWFISFEYVEGKDLRTLFDRCARSGEGPPLWFLVAVMSKVAEGLAYAHARRDVNGAPVSIVHRDVSPQNIVVSYGGDVKLIDFGIAKAAGKLSRTQVGTIKGKFGYMSPEQIRGVEVDQQTDIFSLGICIWELLTLKRLFQADNELLVLEKVRNMKVEPPSRYRDDVPPELDAIVLKALAKNVDERYRAAKDLYKDLDHLAQSKNALATRDEIAQYMRRAFLEPRDSIDAGAAIRTTRERQAQVVTDERRQVQETRAMAADNKGGSDLDIFEGLGKKAGGRPSGPPNGPRTNPPPPPRQDIAKKTLLGMPSPASPGAIPAAPPARPTPPPPPPGRGSLPHISAPPSKSMPAPPPPARPGPPPPAASAAPPPPAPAPAAAAAPPAGGGMDMDWDDEDEATHIFDKADDVPGAVAQAAPRPAAGSLPTPPPAAGKSTLLGMTAPMQASRPSQGPMPPPPPPPSLGGAFARASSLPSGAPGPSALPPPPSIQPMIPPAAPTQQGIGGTMPMQPPGVPPQSYPPPRPPAYPPPPQQMQMPAQAMDYGQPRPPNRMEATALVHPPQSRTGLWIALVAILVLLGGALGAFFLVPRAGTISVTVNDGKGQAVVQAVVSIDGQKKCDQTPCLVDQVSAGSHDVKVAPSNGDPPPDQVVDVTSGRQTAVVFSLGASTTKKGTGLKVAGTQGGVKLYIDDKEIGPLPQEVSDLTPGDHKVRLVGSDRLAPLEKNVVIGKDEMVDLGNVLLKVVKGKATISLATTGARVYLVSGNDRRELPSLPISVDIDTSKTWSLQASKTGYNDYKQDIGFDDGQAEKTYNVELGLKGQPLPTATNTSVTAPPVVPTTPPTTPTAAAAPAGDAYLIINSIPPSSAFLDGVPLGMTPRPKMTVKPGGHRVKFMHPELGVREIGVNVGAGETKPVFLKFPTPE